MCNLEDLATLSYVNSPHPPPTPAHPQQQSIGTEDYVTWRRVVLNGRMGMELKRRMDFNATLLPQSQFHFATIIKQEAK